MAEECSNTITRRLPGNLPRLPREHYQGDAVVMWTLTTYNRATGWLNERFHARFREIMLHGLVREELVCSIYCLMPDHMHFVWMGLSRETDQLRAMAFLRTYLEPEMMPAKLQSQAHDHVLREKERKRGAFAKVCYYVAENPVRAKLAKRPENWNYSGCVIPGYPKLEVLGQDYWDTFWKIYSKLKQADAGEIAIPSFDGSSKDSSLRLLQKDQIVGDDVRSPSARI